MGINTNSVFEAAATQGGQLEHGIGAWERREIQEREANLCVSSEFVANHGYNLCSYYGKARD